MIISHRHKFIFICNGKTGTTSIERGLSGLDESVDMNAGAPGLWDSKHIPAAVAKVMLPSRVWDGYFKFAFVRNPHDWCVSQYKHNFRSRLRIPKLLRHPVQAVGWLKVHWANRERRAKSILDASDIHFLFNHLRRFRGLPFAPGLYQTTYTQDADGRDILDFVGRFETLREDVEAIQRRIGVRFALPHLNATKHAHHSQCLTDDARAAVDRLWAPDFEAFGYRHLQNVDEALTKKCDCQSSHRVGEPEFSVA